MAMLSALAGPLSLREPARIGHYYYQSAPAIAAWAVSMRATPIHLLDVENWLGEPLCPIPLVDPVGAWLADEKRAKRAKRAKQDAKPA